ncbi:ImmA/IrrE family metallo-endopeptidase [Bdellovibrio bacteriovorus]|uniref:ImmA/IrrE family metallo-endopeptidase n=1 Tax=Bdellovibrio bacteriovorus TaxID=959 RepID=UPI003D069A67
MKDFRPERLILARERRGLTKSDVATRLGLSPKTISNYESAESFPDIEVVQKISKTLGFPVDFFYREEVERPDFEKTASFRALTGVAAKYRNQAFAAGTIATEIYSWFFRHYDLPKLDIPNLPGFDPEDAAALVRQEWGLGIKPIPNMIHLLELHGVRVFSLPPDHSNEIDAYCMWFKRTPFVFLNTHTSVERSRFDAAHELAHLVLDRLSEKNSPQAETRAHRFAAALLVPKEDLLLNRPQMVTVQSLMQLKTRYGVSITALAIRMHQLEFISDWQYRNLMIQLSRFRKNEPQPMLKRESSAIIDKISNHVGSSRMLISQLSKELGIMQVELSALLFGLAAVENSDISISQGKRVNPHLRLIK